MTTHRLKIQEQYADAVLNGTKTFEIRKNDRGYEVGDMAYGSCDNGFKCSVCGCKVEDEEHYRVSGVWNFCPQCGRTVVKP